MREHRRLKRFSVVTKALIAVAVVTAVLILVAGWWLQHYFPVPPKVDEAIRVQYLEQYVAIIQVIAVGIVVALVSVIVPLVLPEAHDRFERYKESRRAYSRAKTAVIYLPDRVARVDREKAWRLVEQAHRELHLAETFEDVIIEKGHLKWFDRPDLWLLYNYWQIMAVAEVLRTTEGNRAENDHGLRNRLCDTLALVHRRFGTRGENCVGERWDLEDGSRFRHEDELKEKIKERASGQQST